MRKPSALAPLYRWHAAALAGRKPVVTDDPQAGWYRRKLVKDGPWVAARIYLYQEIDPASGELLADEEMRCEVDGERRDKDDQWTWLCNEPITEAQYRYLLDTRRWAERHSPDDPHADPRKPIDHNRTPLPF